jgi:hypothetical protein
MQIYLFLTFVNTMFYIICYHIKFKQYKFITVFMVRNPVQVNVAESIQLLSCSKFKSRVNVIFKIVSITFLSYISIRLTLQEELTKRTDGLV